MLDRIYESKVGNCHFCDKTTNQYYSEDGMWICDDCLIEYEEERLLNSEEEQYNYEQEMGLK